MPEVVEQRRLSKSDFDTMADYLKETYELRKDKRRDIEKQWDEIDRQVDMEPRAREVMSGTAKDWYPDTESPAQFNALEVILADARRLVFPRGTEWFSVSAEVSDDYTQRWQERREDNPLIAGAGFTFAEDSPFKRLAQQIELDQETANTLVKATMDHYHRMYDFRSNIDLFFAEQAKYGTGVVRVRPVRNSKFSLDFRGVKDGGLEGPAVIPCSIKTTYLDDSPMTTHEGIMVAPLTIRRGMQTLDSLVMAAMRGGKSRGWMPGQIKDLKPLNRSRQVEIIEAEGDFVIPRKTVDSIYLPNFLITIAMGQGDVRVVRMRENPVPFRSYVAGHYMRHDPRSPYGASPLMKGRPVQEAITEVFNDLLAAARLSAQPPVLYDRFDQNLAAQGGPEIYPNAMHAADAPNAVEVLQIGDVAALTNSYLALLKQYEDLTGVNDARRGAPIRSHTTTGGIELEASRGIARTDDFVIANEQGPLTTILYMEYEIIKSVMKKSQPISVGAGGIEGWVNMNAKDLAENVVFTVHGSSGALNEREMAANFFNASNFAVQLATVAAQLQQPINLDFTEIAVEAYRKSGTQNATRFVGESQAAAGAVEAGPGVSGNGVEPAAEDILNALSPQPSV